MSQVVSLGPINCRQGKWAYENIQYQPLLVSQNEREGLHGRELQEWKLMGRTKNQQNLPFETKLIVENLMDSCFFFFFFASSASLLPSVVNHTLFGIGELPYLFPCALAGSVICPSSSLLRHQLFHRLMFLVQVCIMQIKPTRL